MIDIYFWPTPNGYKITIFTEETGLPYNIIPVNIGRGDQFEAKFLEISPNNKMPAIVDHEGPDGKPIAIFESGAILLYLAEKTGKLMPRGVRQRYDVIQWLMFQMGGLGPMLGQAHHFLRYAPEPIPYAINRYTNEAKRLYGVMDRQLKDHEFLAGDYSIADVACFPWILPKGQNQNLDDFPHLKRWHETIGARPAVKAGMAVMADNVRRGPMDDKAKEILFGSKQYERR